MNAYLKGIWRCRYFWLSLVRMDLRTRYRRSVLGIGWSLLHPIAMTVVLCTVFHKLWGMDIREFAPFLLAGMAFWGYVSTSALDGAQCLYRGEPYIRQFPVPMAIYPLRTVLGAAFHFSTALITVIVLTWFMKGVHNLPGLIGLMPGLVLLLVLGWALAVLAGFANVYFPDTKHLLEVLLQILFYATPIMWPPEKLRERGLGWLVDYNPITPCLALVRQPILEGRVPSLTTFAISAAVVLAVTASAVLTLVWFQRRVVFYM